MFICNNENRFRYKGENIMNNDNKQASLSIAEKYNLTIKEAAEYFNIGEHRLRELTESKTCTFVLWVGNKRLIKRKEFEKFISYQSSI